MTYAEGRRSLAASERARGPEPTVDALSPGPGSAAASRRRDHRPWSRRGARS